MSNWASISEKVHVKSLIISCCLDFVTFLVLGSFAYLFLIFMIALRNHCLSVSHLNIQVALLKLELGLTIQHCFRLE